MPRGEWSAKRERQYEHIKDSLEERGKGESVAKEIAARTVNKERAQHGEAKTAQQSTLEDMPAPRRGGLRSHRGEGGRTFRQLYDEARDKGIRGRSRMNKSQLEAALRR
ncbi:MAG: plasmid stabilization protein [Propionivibrio sp.]